MEHQISASHKLDDKEESAGSLEAGMKTDKEGMVARRLEDVFLCLDPVNVLVVCDQFFLDNFHCVDSLGRLQLHHQDLGVRPSANDLDHVEVAEADHVGFVFPRSSASTSGSGDEDWLSGEADVGDGVETLLGSDALAGVVAPALNDGHLAGIALDPPQLVTLLVYQQLALDTLEPWTETQ